MTDHTSMDGPYAGHTNRELIEAMPGDMPEDMWQEIGVRLGVDGLLGMRTTNTWHPMAERLRRYIDMWSTAEPGHVDEDEEAPLVVVRCAPGPD